MMESHSTQAHWFSENPDRAWAERFFLAYIPVWVALETAFMVWSSSNPFGNRAAIGISLLIGLPLVLVPALLRQGKNPNGHWFESYWFKANLFIFIVQFFGNYFISEYFFDVLGMIYNYPLLTINLDSALVGSGEQKVPLMMYGITQATYMTYHTTAIIVMRRIMTSRAPWKPLLFVLLVVVLAYAWARAETAAFANPVQEEFFRYKDKQAMLSYGSIVFAMMFLPSFPLFYFLDEKQNRRWSLYAVAGAGLSAAMLGLFFTDLCAHAVGRL